MLLEEKARNDKTKANIVTILFQNFYFILC